MKRVICPYCFDRISLAQAVFRCANDICDVQVDPVLQERWNQHQPLSSYYSPNGAGPWGWLFGSGKRLNAKCPKCRQTSTQRLCPSCHKELPHSLGSDQQFILAIVGAKGSGKSHFMATLIDELRRHSGNEFGFTLTPLTEATSERYRLEFYDPLFVRRQVLDETKRARDNWRSAEPLVYRIQFTSRGKAKGPVATLSFFDAPGEDLRAEDVVSRFSKYVYHSDGLVLLVDSEPLMSNRQNIDSRATANAVDILERIVRIFEKGRNIPSQQRLPASLAISLSKLDTQRPVFPASSSLWQKPEHAGLFDLHDLWTCSAEIESKLIELGATDLCNLARQRFGDDDVGFFAFSALGSAPDHLRVSSVQPLRVAEPILWLLMRKGLIPTRETAEVKKA